MKKKAKMKKMRKEEEVEEEELKNCFFVEKEQLPLENEGNWTSMTQLPSFRIKSNQQPHHQQNTNKIPTNFRSQIQF